MKQLLVMFMLLCSTVVFAQDVIVKKDGSTVVCRVVELTSSEIVYKKWSDLNGSNYVMNRSDASAINYQNGKKVNLSEIGMNLYSPSNQNDGMRQLNDKALLQIDAAISNPYKRANKLRATALIGGIALVGIGTAFYFVYNGSKKSKNAHDYWYEKEWALPASIGFATCGVAWATFFIIKANKARISADQNLTSSPVYHYNFKFADGSNLSTGIDIINDNNIGHNTIGLGLCYNF